jgi:hypothetical protein
MTDSQAGESSKDLLAGVAQKIGSTLGAVAAGAESVTKTVTAKVASALRSNKKPVRRKSAARRRSPLSAARRRSGPSAKRSRSVRSASGSSATRSRTRKPATRRNK